MSISNRIHNIKKFKKTLKKKKGGKYNRLQQKILSFTEETPFEEILKQPNIISTVFKQYTSMDGVRDIGKFGLGVISQLLTGVDSVVELIFTIQSTISLISSLDSIVNGLLSDPRFSFLKKLFDIELSITGPSIKLNIDLTNDFIYQRVHRSDTKYNKVMKQDAIQKLKKQTLLLLNEFIEKDNKLPENEQAFPLLSEMMNSALQSFIIVLSDWISNIVPEDDGVAGNMVKILIQNRPDLMLEFFVNSIRLLPNNVRNFLLDPKIIDNFFAKLIDQIILEIKENPIPEILQKEFDNGNLQIKEKIIKGKKYYFAYIVSTGMFFLLVGPGTIISFAKGTKLMKINLVSNYLIDKLETIKKESKRVTGIISTIIPLFLIIFIISAKCYQIENNIEENKNDFVNKSDQKIKEMINFYSNIKYNNMVDNWFQKK